MISSSVSPFARHFVPAGASPPGPSDACAPVDLAERLARWLHAFDAIGLEAALRRAREPAAAPARGRSGTAAKAGKAAAVAADLERTRAALTQAIAVEAGKLSPTDDPLENWTLRHRNLQRRMEQLIEPLRAHVRQAVAAAPRLHGLAALDAALERMLAVREQAMLSRAGSLLRGRLQSLPPPAWSDAWRRALLAELELRLEPVAGMVDALADETTDGT